MGYIVLSDGSGVQNGDALFFILRWTRCDFHKMRVRIRCAELVFLHPVGSAGHIVHSGASWAQNVDALFFKLEWAQWGFHQKGTRTRCALSFCMLWDIRVT
jgi:hypothetical protein